MSFFVDFAPYFFGYAGGVYREPFKATPADLSNTEIVSVNGRFCGLVSPAGSVAQWSAIGAQGSAECLGNMLMQPGRFAGSELHVNGSIGRARINDVTGEVVLFWNGASVATAALPASVWRTSSDFENCWVRVQYDSATLVLRARVWAETEAEPTAWTVSYTAPSNLVASGLLSYGASGVATAQCFAWLSWGGVNTCPTPQRASNREYFDQWMARVHTQGGITLPRVMIADVYVPGFENLGPFLPKHRPSVMRAATEPYFTAAFPYNAAPYPAILKGFLDVSRKLPDTVVGRQQISWGALEIVNPDGANDDWLRAHNLRAPVIVRYGDPSWPIYDLATIFTGEVSDLSESAGVIRLAVRDSMSRFDRVLQPELLTDNGGKPVPRALGEVYNVEPPLVDPATLTYQMAPGAIEAIDAVRDSGVALSTVAIGVIESFSASANSLRFQAAHGLLVNSPFTPTGTLPSPLVSGTQYFVKTVVDAFQITVSATVGGATIDLTGSDTITVNVTFPAANVIRAASAHGLTAGASFRLAGTMPGGATAATQYFALAAGLTTTDVSFATAPSGAAVDLTSTLGYAAISVSAGSDYIQLASTHTFTLNEALVVEGSTLPAPITSGEYFRGTATFGDAVKLRATSGGADIDITGAAIAGATVSRNQSGYTMTRWLGASVTTPAYDVNAGDGTVRLFSNPAGQITVDARGEKVSGAYANTARHAIRCLLGDGPGLDYAFRFASAGFFDSTIGLWIGEAANLADVLDAVAESAVASWRVNRVGTFTMRAIGSSDGDVVYLDTDRIGAVEIASKGLPEGYSQLYFRKNHTVQSATDLAGSVSASDRQRYGSDYLEEGAILSVFPNGDNATEGERRDPLVKTSLRVTTSSSDEVYRFPAKQQLIVRVTLPFTALDRFTLGEAIETVSSRAALASTSAVVLGVDESLTRGTVTLTLQIPVAAYFPPI